MYKGVTSDIRKLGLCHLYFAFLQHSNTHFQIAVEMAYSQLNLCLLLPLPSHFSRVRLCVTPSTAAHQAPLSLGFSRQERWSGLPFPSSMHESERESEVT